MSSPRRAVVEGELSDMSSQTGENEVLEGDWPEWAPGANPDVVTLEADYDFSAFPHFAVATDVVIARVWRGRLLVALVERPEHPYKGQWALPGVIVTPGESLDQAAQRAVGKKPELRGVAGLRQMQAYYSPGRDPRGSFTTVIYTAVVAPDPHQRSSSERPVGFWPARSLVDPRAGLAFDHSQLISRAIDHIADRVENSDHALDYVGERFTIAQLREVYESAWGVKLDPGNFRRGLLMRGHEYLTNTGEILPASPDGGRRPELYVATDEWRRGSPIVRPRSSVSG